jgi:hypothetical protein
MADVTLNPGINRVLVQALDSDGVEVEDIAAYILR